jgi:hypothetical protein
MRLFVGRLLLKPTAEGTTSGGEIDSRFMMRRRWFPDYIVLLPCVLAKPSGTAKLDKR